MEAIEFIMQDRLDSKLIYEQMTQEEKDKYNALVARLDDMLTERKSKERRKEAMCIAFPERRINDRRNN